MEAGCCAWKCDWQLHYPTAGFCLVYAGYLLILAAFVLIMHRSFREKATGIPLTGLIALLGAGLVVLPHMPPLDRWIHTGAEHLFPRYLRTEWREYVAWWVHVILLTVIIVQYLVYARREALTALIEKYFYWICAGVFLVVVLTQWLFVLFYQDFFVNEIYPVATLVLAVGYYRTFAARVARTEALRRHPGTQIPGAPLRGLSVLGAWALAVGTCFLYLGTIFGELKAAYHDHAETGYCLVYWVYAVSVVLLLLYAVLLTRRRRIMRGASDRPSL